MAAQPLTTWILLTPDGRHVSLSRTTRPTSFDFDTCVGMLKSLGFSGWLALMVGDYQDDHPVSLTMVREVEPVDVLFARAEDRFQDMRWAI